MNEHNNDSNGQTGNEKYTVVARRYRPKTFGELVGQDTVAHALLRAIETHRVGHAYLFTGARGVGKTSTARIFAKALNASDDGTGNFDPGSEIALAIDSGDDMDVIEIDGASNRGIEEIRQLRSNASIRPTRSYRVASVSISLRFIPIKSSADCDSFATPRERKRTRQRCD